MRKDIELHIVTGDVALDPQNKPRYRNFRWITDEVELNGLLSRFIYGEIDVPYSISEQKILEQGIYVVIPYTPIYQEFKIRIRRIYEDGTTHSYVQNPVNGTDWFLVMTGMYGEAECNAFVSTLPAISEDGFFITLAEGYAHLYASSQSDFNIVQADRQNANCMLACFPGGNYRYPLTGVGLVRWINATNVGSTDLTQIIQDQFSADGVTVKNAAYNYDTHQLELSMDAKED